ncbi:unnamed protein product [Miscanthus lutarioriparius]|uniref:Pentatricopeptide repeat-containing protein n=1 Tax=Miscanthus lutarioriparius TaxID=422564 RepID=A0A811R9R3_9POAL|nr:unnamed protein product [Miscanthus lutarioriparius]
MRRRQHLALAAAAKSHAALLKSGASSPTPWNQLLTAYSGSGSGLAAARRVFDEIPRPDAASWNSLLAAHVAAGAHRDAWRLLRAMHARGLAASTFTLGSALRSAAATRRPELGAQLQSFAVRCGLADNVFSASALLDVYAKCGRLSDARRVFDGMPVRNTVSWNALIAGYADSQKPAEAMDLFLEMQRVGLVPDDGTFAALLATIEGPRWFSLMQQLHGKIVKYGSALGLVVLNAAITAYSQCGALADSRKIFDGIESRDLISWNSILGAYAYHGMNSEAMRFFVRMMRESGIQPDMYSFTSVVSVCSEHGCDDRQGRSIHSLVIKIGLEGVTHVCNAMVAMYTRFTEYCMMEDAYKCFNSLVFKDAVSWNSMLTGYSHHGLSSDALRFFRCMRAENIRTDEFALSAALRSCSDLAVLQLGRQVHSLVIQSGFASNDFVSSSLIFMYSKCGMLGDARKSFEEADKGSSVPWNLMMFGYAQHGQAQTVTDLFNEMLDLEVPLDHVTFVALITACSHGGLVDEGSEILNTMETRIHGNMELASDVASHLFVAEPRQHSTYVLLSSMYSGLGMWSDRATVQKVMKNRGLSKVPGWSWIEVKNEVHSFNADDRSHPRMDEIFDMLRMLLQVAQRLCSSGDEEILVTISSDT